MTFGTISKSTTGISGGLGAGSRLAISSFNSSNSAVPKFSISSCSSSLYSKISSSSPGTGIFGRVGGGLFGPALAKNLGAIAFAKNVGFALAFQGLSQMLTPVPPVEEREQDPRLSFNFSGIQNTSRAGVPVPVIYGEIMAGSVVISANIENEQVEV